MWIYQRVYLLHCGNCLYLDIVWIYKRADLLYFGYYIYIYLEVDKISVQTLRISAYGHFVLLDNTIQTFCVSGLSMAHRVRTLS